MKLATGLLATAPSATEGLAQLLQTVKAQWVAEAAVAEWLCWCNNFYTKLFASRDTR